MKTFKPSKYCKKCGGKCCQYFPGSYLPQDVFGSKKASYSLFKRFVIKHNACIDIDVGKQHKIGFYLRPLIYGELINQFVNHSLNGGRCSYHTNTGCKAPKRPLTCKMLKPAVKEGQDCRAVDETRKSVWNPYKKYFIRFIKEQGKELEFEKNKMRALLGDWHSDQIINLLINSYGNKLSYKAAVENQNLYSSLKKWFKENYLLLKKLGYEEYNNYLMAQTEKEKKEISQKAYGFGYC